MTTERKPYNVTDIADVEGVKTPDPCGYCGEPVASGWYHEACHAKAERDHARDVAKARASLARDLPPDALKVPDLPTFARRDAEAQRAAVAVGSWLTRNPLPCLWLHGPAGVGKTTLAALALVAVQDEAVQGGRAVGLAFRSAPAVVGKREAPAPVTAALAVLDDVGRHRITPLKVDRLTAWAEAVCSHGVPLIVTSNYRPSELAEVIGKATDEHAAEALVDRLRGRGSGLVIEVARGPFGGVTTATIKS